MKTRTRIVAWMHIILYMSSPVVWLAFGMGLAGASAPWIPVPLKDKLALSGISLGVAITIGLVLLISVAPWFHLLSKRMWAWWYLTILYGIGTASMVIYWIPIPKPGEPVMNALYGSIGIFLIFGVTFLILLTDRPKRRKTPTRRRRRTTTAASTRRRRRRRSSNYDY